MFLLVRERHCGERGRLGVGRDSSVITGLKVLWECICDGDVLVGVYKCCGDVI